MEAGDDSSQCQDLVAHFAAPPSLCCRLELGCVHRASYSRALLYVVSACGTKLLLLVVVVARVLPGDQLRAWQIFPRYRALPCAARIFLFPRLHGHRVWQRDAHHYLTSAGIHGYGDVISTMVLDSKLIQPHLRFFYARTLYI